ncbi:hypothetical protein N7478_003775 [Penicillium angulare]|uniref:uncharacterized protein n=1 Tax=Penicillium angulare TaxID=116970 RepID=UPI00253FBD9A|nr:uncharacterized protein N7478_003775 [Penicillium angulare]KAJ5288089.1 hypothetical protein N7478_003775 [Penicillium angulare]
MVWVTHIKIGRIQNASRGRRDRAGGNTRADRAIGGTTAPQPLRTSNRPIRVPVSYSQEQERDAASRRQRKNQPEPHQHESATAGHVAPTPDQTDPILRAILEAFGKIETSNKYFHQEIEARHVERSRFQSQITELRNELCRRDERYQEEIKRYKVALAEMQEKVEELKQTALTANLTACTCNGHYEELRAERLELHTVVTSPSIGRSWASIMSQPSVVPSNTWAVRSSLGLSAVVLDVRSASDEIKALVDDPV